MFRAALLNLEEGEVFELLGDVWEVRASKTNREENAVIYLDDLRDETHELKVIVPFYDHEVQIEEYHHD